MSAAVEVKGFEVFVGDPNNGHDCGLDHGAPSRAIKHAFMYYTAGYDIRVDYNGETVLVVSGMTEQYHGSVEAAGPVGRVLKLKWQRLVDELEEDGQRAREEDEDEFGEDQL